MFAQLTTPRHARAPQYFLAPFFSPTRLAKKACLGEYIHNHGDKQGQSKALRKGVMTAAAAAAAAAAARLLNF